MDKSCPGSLVFFAPAGGGFQNGRVVILVVLLFVLGGMLPSVMCLH